jgi:PAS domain S-box-containing protein
VKPPDQEKQHDLQLRAAAETRLDSSRIAAPAGRSADELLHELQVHQIELELQNETLRQTQMALEESRDRYVDLYEFAPVGYLTLSGEGLIESINLSGTVLLGMERSKLMQRRFSQFVTPEDRERWHRFFAGLLQQDDKRDCELLLQRDDATRFSVRVDCLRMLRDGQAPTVRVVLTDVTERRRTEMALQQSRQLLELTMQISHTGGWDLDLVDYSSHRTRGHDRIFGYESPLPAWSYETFLEHVVAEDRPEVDRHFQEAIAATGDWDFVCRIRRVDGQVRWIEAAGGHQRDETGTVTRMAGVVRDITEAKLQDQALHEKNAELELARSAAEKANLAKSDFLSSMSHELRTPLNAILGFAQLMESSTPAPTAKQQRDLDQILGAGWYLLELINEILDLALIESGRATLSREAVSLGEIMLECWAMIEPQAQKRKISVTFPKLDQPCYVDADRTRVKQVMINLLFNAIKYNEPGGQVTIDISRSQPNSIRVSIRDTGAGLPAEKLSELFQPFNRLGREAGAEEGTGIGLVVTKRLVELMGGTIGVDSTVGVGSVFWIELALTTAPLTALQKAEHAALVRPPADGTPQRSVLYVEDNPANLALIEDLVARLPGLHMISAADGDLGIEFARAYQPAVILMDINLPGISGLEAMKIIRADPETAHIPIIALSANALAHDIARGMEAGFFRYLTKPIRLKEFMDALDSALELAAAKPGHGVKP